MVLTKDQIRQKIWQLLTREKVARFPFPIRGRIPNFQGAEEAAHRLNELSLWQKARVIKCNPDSPQTSVRKKALLEGKKIYMAVPRLREEKCFVELDPKRLKSQDIAFAATIKGAFKLGRQVSLEEMEPIDLIVAGSVAVSRDGARVGKGGGYSDLEYALARTAGLVDESTPIVTTVHSLQITEESWEMLVHDIPLDFIITPDEIFETNHNYPKPEGIYWNILKPEMLENIPVLRKRRET